MGEGHADLRIAMIGWLGGRVRSAVLTALPAAPSGFAGKDAPVAPSTTRWSQLSVSFMTFPGNDDAVLYHRDILNSADRQDSGISGLMIAVNSSTPNIPRLEIVKVLPSRSGAVVFYFSRVVQDPSLLLRAGIATWYRQNV